MDSFDIDSFDDDIITLCQTPHTALQAIHRLLTKGSIKSRALLAIYQRVLTDQDVDGAYYLAVLAQTIDDLPFDALPLVKMVLNGNDTNSKLALWEKLPNQAKITLKQSGFGIDDKV